MLERDLLQGSTEIHLKEPMVIDMEIEPNAPFAEKRVCKLGLPPGCLIVRCVEAGHEFIPTAQTRLEAYMRITAVIAPEASEGLEILRCGCRGGNHCRSRAGKREE
jgi:CIC family chloride channel protein